MPDPFSDLQKITSIPITFFTYLASIEKYSLVLRALIWKDFLLRFRHRWFNSFSVFLQPMITVVIICFAFEGFVSPIFHQRDYPVCVYLGVLVWQFISRSINLAGTALRSNKNVLTRTYFPRILIPCAAIFGGLTDFFVGFPGLLLCIWFFKVPVSIFSLIGLIPFIGLMVVVGFGTSFWLSILDYKYDDISYMMPFLTQFLFIASPITYIPSGFSRAVSFVYSLNPIVAVLGGMRHSLVGKPAPTAISFSVSIFSAFALLIGGAWMFCINEPKIADTGDT